MKLFLNCNDNDITTNKKQYLLRAADRLGISNVVDIKDREGDEPTDCILNIEPFNFLRGNKWTGIWEIDLLCDRPETSKSDWVYSDIIFVAGLAYPKRLNGLEYKVCFLPQACDPALYTIIKDIKKDYDFVQCGSTDAPHHNERARLVSLLRGKYSFCDFGKNHKVQDYISRIARGKVQFIRSMASGIAEGEVAQRFFECLAIGPVLTNYVKDLEYLGLEEGVDYFSYKDDKEMLEKMETLTRDPDFRLRMAENGRKKALMLHTFEHRLISILNTIKWTFQ